MFDEIFANSDNVMLEQLEEDWDAIVRMFTYLIEFFKSLFA